MGLWGVWYLKNLNIGDWEEIERRLVPKKPKQYGGLKWESFISRQYAMFFPASWGFSGIQQGFSTDTWPTNYWHAANSRPTVSRQSADCWQKIFVKGGKRQSADSFLGELFFTFSDMTGNNFSSVYIFFVLFSWVSVRLRFVIYLCFCLSLDMT